MEEKVSKRALEKIQRALNLAKAADDHESQTAMLLAQQLMAKHGITLEEVEGSSEDDSKEVMRMFAGKPTKLQWWNKVLGRIVGDNFRCYTYTQSGNGKSRMVFLGLKDDTKIAREVYLYAIDSIDYLSIHYLNQKGIEGITQRSQVRNDYIRGFLSGLEDRFKEQVKSNEWGLILQKDALVEEEYESMHLTKGSSSSAVRAGDAEAYASGHSDGKRMDHMKKVLK